MGDVLAAIGAGLDEGPVRVDPVGPLPAVVFGAVGLDVAVAFCLALSIPLIFWNFFVTWGPFIYYVSTFLRFLDPY